MEIIRHTNGKYVHVHNNKPEHTSNKQAATQFSCGGARRFISNQIPKKNRNYYIVEEISEPPELLKEETRPLMKKPTVTKNTTKNKPPRQQENPQFINAYNETVCFAEFVKKNIHEHLDERAEQLRTQLHEYEDKICDYRHFLRDPRNKLNGVELCRAAKFHRKLEQERSLVKKELQRIQKMIDYGDKLCDEVITFDYEEYKPRTSIDFNAVVKGEK